MKKMKLFVATLAISAAMTTTALAGEWKQDQTGWWYQNDDGSYTKSGWHTIDGKSYYFGDDGYMFHDCVTPDGYSVGADGAWIENLHTPSVSYDESTYQGILDSYTAKLKAATPTLISEYEAEAKQNSNGLSGLAEIANAKVSKSAEIVNEGVGKMAEIYYNSGSGKYSEYEEWAGKLYDIYMEEAGKIYDAYINSAM